MPMDVADKIRSMRAVADEMEGLSANLRDACEDHVNSVSHQDKTATMPPNLDAAVNRIIGTLRHLTSRNPPLISNVDRSRWQDEIAQLAAERVKFIIANRERLMEAWVSETGCKPSESEIVEQHDTDGTVRVSVRKKPIAGPRPCRHGFVGRCPYREQDPPLAGWVPEDDCHGKRERKESSPF